MQEELRGVRVHHLVHRVEEVERKPEAELADLAARTRTKQVLTGQMVLVG
jgi:hypothetical protein